MPTAINQDPFSQDFLGISMESELSFDNDKLADTFVGECADLSYSQHRSSNVIFPDTQTIRDYSSLSYQKAPLTTSSEPPLSIDTSRDRAVERSSATISLPSAHAHNPGSIGTSQPNPVFKSPTTPASASRYFAQASPTVSRDSDHHRTCPPNTFSQSSHMFGDAFTSQRSAHGFRSHFFAQSSGNFIPPLETSCSSFPLLIFFLFLCLFLLYHVELNWDL
jgi:hypothetical protein